MNKIQWTRRTAGTLAVAFVGAAAVGALAFGGSVSAQSQTPPAATASPLMPGKPGAGGFKMRFGTQANSPLAVAAKALGMDETALRTELQSGKTIADVAKAKGVDSAKIITAIVEAQKADVAQAVSDGKLTQAQADQILANAETHAANHVNSTAPMGRGGHGGKGGMLAGDPANAPLAVAAKALGIDEAALRTELQSGKTIADVAKAKGVDTAKIVTAIVDARKIDVAKAVTDDKLTQAQADQMLANAEARATDLVNGKAPTGRHNGGRGPGFGPGRGFGPGHRAPGTAPATPAATGEGA